VKCVLEVGVRAAVAKSEADRKVIFGCIENAGGSLIMNQAFKAAMRKWVLLSAGLRELQLHQEEDEAEGELAARFVMRLAVSLPRRSRGSRETRGL